MERGCYSMVSIEERREQVKKAQAKRMKEYQKSLTPSQRKEMIAKGKQTKADNNVVKSAINNVFSKDYYVYDNNGKYRKASGIEAMAFELIKVMLDKETSPSDKVKIFESMSNYSGNKPTEKKETTSLNINSYEGFITQFSNSDNCTTTTLIDSEEVESDDE